MTEISSTSGIHSIKHHPENRKSAVGISFYAVAIFFSLRSSGIETIDKMPSVHMEQ